MPADEEDVRRTQDEEERQRWQEEEEETMLYSICSQGLRWHGPDHNWLVWARCTKCKESPHLTSPHVTSPHLTSPHLTSPHLTSPHLRGTRIKKMWENNKDKERRYSRYDIMHPFSIVLLLLVLLLHPPNIFDNTSMDNTYQLFSHHRHIWTNIVISRSIIILNLFSPLLVLRIGSCYVMRHTTQIPQTRVYSLYSGRIERIT